MLLTENQKHTITLTAPTAVAREFLASTEMYAEYLSVYGDLDYTDFQEYVELQEPLTSENVDDHKSFSALIDAWNEVVTKNGKEYFQDLQAKKLDNISIGTYDIYENFSDHYNTLTKTLSFDYKHPIGFHVEHFSISGEFCQDSPWCLSHDIVTRNMKTIAFIHFDPKLTDQQKNEILSDEKVPKGIKDLLN